MSPLDLRCYCLSSCIVLLFILVTVPSFAQQTALFQLQKTSAEQYAAGTITADLNGDGIPDLIESYSRVNPSVLFSVQLGNGDGTFGTPMDYSPTVNQQYAISFVTADFNRDGKADIGVITGADQLIYFGNGDGTLATPIHTTLPGTVPAVVVADFNLDGIPDLALATFVGNTYQLDVEYGTGNGQFEAPQNSATLLTSTQELGSFVVGDFNSDAKADIAYAALNSCSEGGCANTDVHILYGTGSGFTDSLVFPGAQSDYIFSSGDVNGDGRTDLVGELTVGSGQNTLILYGQSSHTVVPQYLTANGFGFSLAMTTFPVGDYNGDGRNDFAMQVANNTTNMDEVDIFLQGPKGTFTLEPVVIGTNSFELGDLNVADFNRDRKPDLLLPAKDDSGQDQNTYIYDYLNTTSSSNFAGCNYPKAAAGINTCISQEGSVTHIDVAAIWFEPLRKVEVWVDGTKISEQHHIFDKYGWLKSPHSYSAGTHQADIYTAGYDNVLQHSTVSFTVSGSN